MERTSSQLIFVTQRGTTVVSSRSTDFGTNGSRLEPPTGVGGKGGTDGGGTGCPSTEIKGKALAPTPWPCRTKREGEVLNKGEGEETSERPLSRGLKKGPPTAAVGGSTGGHWQPTARCYWWLTD